MCCFCRTTHLFKTVVTDLEVVGNRGHRRGWVERDTGQSEVHFGTEEEKLMGLVDQPLIFTCYPSGYELRDCALHFQLN